MSSIANKFVSATLLVASGTLAPVFTVILSYFDPDEHTTPQLSYLGSIGIIGGIVLVTFGRNGTVKASVGSISLHIEDDDGFQSVDAAVAVASDDDGSGYAAGDSNRNDRSGGELRDPLMSGWGHDEDGAAATAKDNTGSKGEFGRLREVTF